MKCEVQICFQMLCRITGITWQVRPLYSSAFDNLEEAAQQTCRLSLFLTAVYRHWGDQRKVFLSLSPNNIWTQNIFFFSPPQTQILYLSLSVSCIAKVISPLRRHSHYRALLCAIYQDTAEHSSFFSVLYMEQIRLLHLLLSMKWRCFQPEATNKRRASCVPVTHT